MESTNYLFSGGLSPAQCFDILKDSKYSDFVVRCDGKSFRVHKFMLATKSDYFRAAIDGGFKESAENQITMMDVRPAAMAVVILYLYWGATSLSQFYPHLNSTFHDQFTPLEINYIQSFAGHLDIYLLADRLMLPGLRSLADEAVGWSLARLRKDGRIAELEESARMVYERIPETDGYIRPNITAAMVSDPAMPKHVPKQYDPAGVAACLHLLSLAESRHGLGQGRCYNPRLLSLRLTSHRAAAPTENWGTHDLVAIPGVIQAIQLPEIDTTCQAPQPQRT